MKFTLFEGKALNKQVKKKKQDDFREVFFPESFKCNSNKCVAGILAEGIIFDWLGLIRSLWGSDIWVEVYNSVTIH